MKGFEKEDWTLKIEDKYRGWKVARHKKFDFISIFFVKKEKGGPNKYTKWGTSFNPRDPDRQVSIDVYYNKLAVQKIPEVFDKYLKYDDVKFAILNHIFKVR